MIYFTKYCLLANRCPPRSSKIAYETGCKYITQLNIDPFTSTTMYLLKNVLRKMNCKKKWSLVVFSRLLDEKIFPLPVLSRKLVTFAHSNSTLEEGLATNVLEDHAFQRFKDGWFFIKQPPKSPEKTQSDRIHGDIYLHFLDFYGEGRKIYDTID